MPEHALSVSAFGGRRVWASRVLRTLVVALACLALAIAAYWSVLLEGQRSQRRQVEEQTWLRVGQLALAVSVQVQTLLLGLDYTLQSLAAVYPTQDADAFAEAVAAAQGAYPAGTVTQIAVANAAGDIVYSSLERDGRPRAGVSIHDREHFIVHADRQVQGMYVSRPVRGRVSQAWSIQLTRAIEREGTFLGVLVLSIPPEHIARYFGSLAAGTDDVIALLRADGAYLARSQRQNDVLGTATPAARQAFFPPGASSGSYVLTSPVDGVQRLYGWSRVPGQPLVASVGLDRARALGPMEDGFARVLARNAAGTALLVLGALVGVWLAWQRERSDQLRQRAERRFARLAQEAPGGLFQCRVDERGRLQMLFSTPQFHLLHGVPATSGALQTRALANRVWPEDLPGLIDSVRASLGREMPWDHRYRTYAGEGREGAVRWLHGHARVQREDDGTLLWHGYVHDVTQDQAMREVVRASEERLRRTLRAVRDGLWEWECDTGRLLGDERCADILGQGEAVMVLDVHRATALVHPADQARLRAHLQRHVGSGEEFRLEVRLQHADGDWRSAEVRGEVTRRDDRGLPLRMLGTLTDIHERVAQGRLISALLDKGSAHILVVTPGQNILYANERAAQAFGLRAGTPHPAVPFGALQPAGAGHAQLAAAHAQARERGGARIEMPLRLANGDDHWFDMQGVLLDGQGGDGNVVWTLVDTDARRRAEAALDRARRTLGVIIDRFPAGILVVDAQGSQVVAANTELAGILRLGRPAGSLVGVPVAGLRALLPPTLAEALLRTGADGQFLCGKSVHPLQDGRFLEVEALVLSDAAQALGHCWVVHDVTERRQRETRLEALALTDALTGVPNRRAFMERLDIELQHLQAGRVDRAALLMLDIDHFKRVNDTWGHAVGDVVLRDLAQTVVRALRKDDMVGRIGGEEFAVLLSGASVEAAHKRAEALRCAVQERELQLADGTALRITVSLGVYAMTAQDASGPASLERADAAMYFSKRNGRNQSTVWHAGLPALAATQGEGSATSAGQAPPAG